MTGFETISAGARRPHRGAADLGRVPQVSRRFLPDRGFGEQTPHQASLVSFNDARDGVGPLLDLIDRTIARLERQP